jgi:hypothetical protein
MGGRCPLRVISPPRRVIDSREHGHALGLDLSLKPVRRVLRAKAAGYGGQPGCGHRVCSIAKFRITMLFAFAEAANALIANLVIRLGMIRSRLSLMFRSGWLSICPHIRFMAKSGQFQTDCSWQLEQQPFDPASGGAGCFRLQDMLYPLTSASEWHPVRV